MSDTSILDQRTASPRAATVHVNSSSPRSSISGVMAGIVTAVGFASLVLVPGGGTTSAKSVVNFYESSSKRAWAVALGFVLVAGCLLTMWFFTQLKARLSDSMVTRLAHLFAVFGAASIAVGTGILLGPTGVQMNTGQAFVGVPIATTLAQSGLFVIIGCGIYPIAAAIFLMSLEARRQRTVLPRWLATAGLVVAVLLLGSAVGSPAILLPVWLVVAGLTGWRTNSHSV
jgi:hypothetical protein